MRTFAPLFSRSRMFCAGTDVAEHQLAGVAAAHAQFVSFLRYQKLAMPFSIRNAVTLARAKFARSWH
jgi:hypothetical protein